MVRHHGVQGGDRLAIAMSSHTPGERGGGDGSGGGGRRVHMFTNYFGNKATREADALTREGKFDEAIAILVKHLKTETADGSAHTGVEGRVQSAAPTKTGIR